MFDLSARRHAATSGLRSAQLLIAAGLAASVGGAASGALIVSTWAAAASGTWNTASNWSPNANFPNNGTPVGDTYHAIIDATGPNYTVTLNTNVTLDMLTLNSANATLSHSGGSFNPGVANISAGTYRLVGGSITGGVWNISGTGVFDVASSGNNNIIGATINGDIILSANSSRSRVSGATRFGTARLSGPSSSLGFAPGYTLLDAIRAEGAGGGSRNVEMNGSPGLFTIGATGSITHAAGAGGSLNIGGSQWYGGTMTLVNNGLIQMDASGQTMSIEANSFTNNGTLRVTAGTTTISSWTNAGLVEISGGTLNLGAFNTTSGIGAWNRTGGAVNINGAINNAGSSFTLDNSTGSWTLNGGSITGGEVNLADAAQLLVGASSSNTLSGVDLNGDLILSAGSARARVIGATRFDTARLSGASSSLAFAPGYTLMDAVVAQGAGGGSRNVEMNGAAGTFTIGATGSITHAAGAGGGLNIGGSQWFGGAMTLVNDGLIQMDASGQAMSIEANSFTNNGTLRVTNGTTTISSWSNAGLVEVSGGTLNLGAFNVTSGIGTWNRTGGAVNINGALNNTGSSFTLDNSTGSWTLLGGSITGGEINFAGGAQLLVGASNSNALNGVDLNGDLILSAGSARARVTDATRFDTALLSGASSSLGFANDYTLLDAIRAQGAGGGSRNVEMNGSAGTVTIGATGSITHAAGTGGGFNIGGSQWFGGAMTLVNNGLIQMDASGQAMSIAANSFTNNGTLRVTAGTTTISSWSNAGLVEVSGGTLNLGAFNTTSGIGAWNRTGGAVNINGAINNAGSSFTLNNSTGSWTLNGGSITGGEVNFADSAQLLVGANSSNALSGVDLNGDLILSASSARARVSGATRFDAARFSGSSSSLGFANGYILLDAIVAEGAGGGSRSVEMNGSAGTVTIGATGSITHATGAGGGLNIGGSQWFGGAMTLVNNGLIQMDASGQAMSIAANSFTNNGTLRVTTGTTTISSWSNAGLVEVSGGTLNLGAFNTTSGIGAWNRTGGAVNINGALNNTGSSFTLNNSTGSWTLLGGSITGGEVNFADSAQLLVGANSANTLSGVDLNGDLILSANSSRSRVSGATRFDAALLSGASSSLGFAPGYTLLDAIRAEGAGGGSRNVEMNGSAGTFTIGATGSITHAAGAGGGFNIGGSQWFGGAMTLVNNGLIQMDASGQAMSIDAASFTNNGTLRVTNGTTTISSWSNAGLVEVSGGTLNLGAFNTTSGIGAWNRTGGAVNINGAINNAGSSFTLDNSTGSWTLLGGSITGGEVNFADSAQLLVGANSANTLSGVDLNGDLILSAGSARTRVIGATRFDAALLSGASSSLGIANGYTLMDAVVAQGAGGGSRNVEMNGAAGTFTIGATGSITHAAGAGGGLEIGGAQWFGGAMTLVNQGAVRAQASGQTTSIVAPSFDNQGSLEARGGGTLVVDVPGAAAFINNGQITAGTGGTVRFVDGYNTASSTGQLTVEIGGALAANYGRFNITGATAINGSDIELDFVNGFNADWGDKFTILTFTSGLVTGDFSTFDLPTLTDAVNWRWYSESTATSVSVGVRHTADVNRDNSINFADLNIIVSNFNSFGSEAMGDVDGDGFIGFADLNRVLSFFNTSAPINTVPAPGGAALLVGLAGVMLRRRR